MKEKSSRIGKNKGFSLLLSIIIVFFVLGAVVLTLAYRLSKEMSNSAIQNLSESLDLIEHTIEAILRNEAEFQRLVAHEAASAEDPLEYIRTYERSQTMVKLSLILSGETEGISNNGEIFSTDHLDFSAGGTIDGLPVSQSYLNYMGTWAYTLQCPVEQDGQELGTLYVEYTYDYLDKSLPEGFYNKQATLYIMDAESERFVLKPEGMGARNAGHVNLADFYRANNIVDSTLQADVARCLEEGDRILFYHNIRAKSALSYMWPVNNGTIFMVGYVPVEAIQQEGKTVNQNILLVVTSMLVAFLLCCILYYLSQRQQARIRKEQEAERELHNSQLAEALRAAQIASNSKTTFLSNMSHDIRTPMNAVLGFTTLLAKDAENPAKVREYTKKITASGKHLLSLINDVLDVSKIESGKVVLTFEKFSLNDVVSSVDAIIQPMAKAKNQHFHVEVTGINHEYFMGDETRVNQILINLLSNAIKYTPEGGSIWFRIIGLKQRSAQYEHIRIEVEDNGYGMTQDYLETIFDAFTRAENSTTNKIQGTGLGMAITKSIVELMGGTIDVTSELDQGSLFRVDLEFRILESQSDRQFWVDNGITKVLAVDGDLEACQNILALMKDSGVVVDTVPSVEDALLRIQSSGSGENYHLILLDWDTLDSNAAGAVKRIRSLLPDTLPILFMAAFDTDGTEEALRMEKTGLLTKPFFVSAFKDKILEMQAEASGTLDNASGDLDSPIGEISLEGLRFLAAEDNDINAEILAELLEMEGASCEITENGKLAVERFEIAGEDEFDAILMDVQMPVMNGYEATRAIRALQRGDARTIPIIAMTANAFAEDEKAALDAGMNVHVAKPIDIELLKKAIRNCIDERERE